MKAWERKVRAIRYKRALEAEGRDYGDMSSLKRLGFAKKPGKYNIWSKEKPNYYKVTISENPGQLGGIVVHVRSGGLTSGGHRRHFGNWEAAARWAKSEMDAMERDPKRRPGGDRNDWEAIQETGMVSEEDQAFLKSKGFRPQGQRDWVRQIGRTTVTLTFKGNGWDYLLVQPKKKPGYWKDCQHRGAVGTAKQAVMYALSDMQHENWVKCGSKAG